MKASEIRNLSAEEIVIKIQDLKEELCNMRFQNATNQLDNPMRIPAVKKDIAKLKTILREKEMGLGADIN